MASQVELLITNTFFHSNSDVIGIWIRIKLTHLSPHEQIDFVYRIWHTSRLW